jgi:hypothetical protein
MGGNGRDEELSVTDATMAEVGRGLALSHGGEHDAARRLFEALWEDVGGEGGDPLHRCAVAHAMADMQDDPADELVWDLRALAAADLISDGRAAEAGMTASVASLYPSLHLNLGECYRKLGQQEPAREHLRRGLAAAGALPDDGYGRMVRGGLDRLSDRLSTGSPTADR